MRNWVVSILGVGLVGGCLAAMGVGATAMAELWVALCMIAFVALLIAWLFLRKLQPAEAEPDKTVGPADLGTNGDERTARTIP